VKTLRTLASAVLALFPVAIGAACSLQNQEGPDVTCADLDCGRINACEEGIIAQCVDGKTVKFRVCDSSDVCAATWQVTGQYKCSEDATDCEGCRPDRTGCDAIGETTSSASSGGGGNAATSSTATGG
jgi:hypothetical protein